LLFLLGTLAVERAVSPTPSLERLDNINSIYLQKGKVRLGYGLFINNDRIVGVRASRWYLLASVMHAPILIVTSLWGFLLLFLGLGFGLVLLLVPVFLELVWAGLNLIFVLPALERVLRGKEYSIDELEERKDFELRRSDVWEVEVRQSNGLAPGLVEFRPRLGAPMKLRMLWTRSRAKRFAEMFQLVETFTGRQPYYNYKGWAIWRMN
jgi:hypothetical protein